MCLMIFPLLLFFGLFFSNVYPEINARNTFEDNSCLIIDKWKVQFVSGFSYRWYPVFNVTYVVDENANGTVVAQAYDTILSYNSGTQNEGDKYLKKYDVCISF